jgi:predicted metalloprotease with PDZ domain
VKGGAGDDDSDNGRPGSITDVRWDGPSFKAGLTPEMQLLGVNDQVFSVTNLREAIVTAENNQAPIKLLLKRGNELITLTVDYHGGLRYPHLQRVESTPDLLDTILTPVK